MNRSAVLIASSDAVAAALLGASVELIGLQPVFQLPHESPAVALRRLRPAVLLLEYDPARRRESIAGPALMAGVRVALFGPATRTKRLAAVSHRLGVPCFTLPVEHEPLAALVRRLADEAGGD